MGNYINDALLSAKPHQKQQVEAKKLVRKWDKTGLLDGLNKEFQKNTMAVLLENQAKQLISENSRTNPSGGAGDEEWSGVALPLVRRIFGEIAAQEFVSVQPMNLPSGLVFFLDFKYGTTNAGQTKGESVFGKTGPNSPYPSAEGGGWGTGGFYGAGRSGFSTNTSSYENTEDGQLTFAAVATAADYNQDTELSESRRSKGYLDWAVTIPTASFTNPDLQSVRSWRSDRGSNQVADAGVLQHLNKVVGGNVLVYVSASTGANATSSIQVDYQVQPPAESRGDFEDTIGSAVADTLEIPEIDLQLKSQAIVAKTRKLKAVWTPELAQDLNAYHSVDAEAELTSMLSEYISMEIDLEILDMLLADAQTVDYWSLRSGYDYDSNTKLFGSNTFTGTRFEWWQTLGTKIQKVSNEIHRLTLRGGANFLVCSPKVSTIIESLPGYMSNTDGNKAQYAMGVQSIGTIQNRWNIYKNPYMQENTILVGFRGGNFLETGAVYAPYVPLIMTPLVYDPSDFTPRKGVMTRYAKKMIRPEFYGKVFVEGLEQL